MSQRCGAGNLWGPLDAAAHWTHHTGGGIVPVKGDFGELESRRCNVEGLYIW